MRTLRSLPYFVLLLLASLAHAASPIPEIKFEKYVLPNGLQVILHEDRSTPIVTVDVWYHAGAKNERPGRTGFAHLFEHMMFQGSKHHDSNYFDPFQQAGGKLNGSTTQDRTNYWETVPANYLELALWMESDRMGFLLPAMTQKKLDNQRDVVRNERRQSYENRPYGLVHEALLAAMFPADHPYSWSVIGSMADLAKASREDVAGFFRRYYNPANASLCIAGDFDPTEAKKLVEKYFAPLPAGPKVEKMKPLPAELKAEKRIAMTDRVGLPRLIMAWPSVPDFAADEPALDILGDILSSGKTSRLEQSLVREKQIAQSVNAGQNSQEIAGLFLIDATAQQGHTLAESETAILEQIRHIQEQPPTTDELTRALNRIESHIIRSMESNSGFGGLADQLNRYNVMKGDPGYLSKDFERYQKVTPEDIVRVAKKYLGPGRIVLEVLPGTEQKITPDPRIPAEEAREKLAKSISDFPLPMGEGQGVRAEDKSRLALPQPGPAPKFALPPFKRAKLSNGIELLVVEKHDLPLVAMNLVFPAGKTMDSPHYLGRAALTAAVWDEGTKDRTADQISDELGGIGADISFSAAWDTTSARLFSLKSHLPKALDIYADLLINPIFPEKEMEREKKMTLGRLVQVRNEPVMLAQLAVGPALYGDANPYGFPLLGTPESIKSITQYQLVNFYKANYVTNGATLIAVGDITTDELVEELDKEFADWKARGNRPIKNYSLPLPKPTRIILIDKPGAAQSVISVAQLGAERKSPDYYSLSVLNTVLGGQFISRLNMNLRENKGFTYGARSAFDWRVHAPGPFVASSSVQTAVTAPALVEFLKEIDGLRGALPIAADELDAAKTYITRGYPADFETAAQIAQHLETLVEYKLPDDYFNTLIPRITAVTADDVLSAAKKYIHPNNLSIIIVGDREKIEKSLQELPAGKNLELMQFDENFQLVPANENDQSLPAEKTTSIGMKLVRIPAGEFMMGGGESAEELVKVFSAYKRKPDYFKDEYPRHRMKISKPFYLGKYEVTVGDFKKFAAETGYKTQAETDNGANTSKGPGGWGYNAETGKMEGRDPKFSWRNPGFPQTDEQPVLDVTWFDAIEFCKWLGKKEGKTVRLPTEAEWEYACRAGTETRYHVGGDPAALAKNANVMDDKGRTEFPHVQEMDIPKSGKHGFTAPVGGFAPNKFGLCDMHGNVWEWCADWYGEDYYSKSPIEDPQGPENGAKRVRRGGAWNSFPLWARASFRNWNVPESRCVNLGFRVLMEE